MERNDDQGEFIFYSSAVMHPDANNPILKIFTAPYDTMNG